MDASDHSDGGRQRMIAVHFLFCLAGRAPPVQWRQNGRDSVSNHQPHDCLHNSLFRRRSKKMPKLCVTGLCVGNSPGTGEFLAQRASNSENISIWWRHHDYWIFGATVRDNWNNFICTSVCNCVKFKSKFMYSRNVKYIPAFAASNVFVVYETPNRY